MKYKYVMLDTNHRVQIFVTVATVTNLIGKLKLFIQAKPANILPFQKKKKKSLQPLLFIILLFIIFKIKRSHNTRAGVTRLPQMLWAFVSQWLASTEQ